jgi:hypothetical protein
MCLNAKHIFSSYPFALLMRASRGLGSAKWHVVRNECHDMKGKIVGHYERSQLTSNTFRRLEMNLIWRYNFSRR